MSVATIGLVTAGPSPARATFLTGAIVYSTDSAGAPSAGEFWNTVGGDNRYNLYVAAGPTDPILNPGNSSSTGLNIALPVGTYTYDLFGENAVVFPNYGLALFFNGGNGAPSIAAYLAPGGFSAVPVAAGSVGQDGSGMVSPGSTSFVDGANTVSLSGFTWAPPTTGGLDRVSPTDGTPSGAADFLGSITLTVEPTASLPGPVPVPEPASMALLGLGLVGAAGATRRKLRPSTK